MIGERQRAEMLNWLLGKTPATSAMSSGSMYLDLYLTDPGDHGQDAVAITGGSYAPATTTPSTWGAATYGDPTIAANAVQINWPTASGNWAGSAFIRYVGAWKHASNRTEANFVGRFALVTPRTVLNGQTFAFEIGKLHFRITSGGAVSLQQAYDLGGNVDAVVNDGSNVLRVRAEDNTSDVLLRIKRRVGPDPGQSTKLKAPDSITAVEPGTDLELSTGQGFDGTGATPGSNAGSLLITLPRGGNAQNASAGEGGGALVEGGKGGSTTGASGVPQVGGALGFKSGDGGNSSNAAVAGANGADFEIDVGAGGDGSGEGGSAAGLAGTLRLGKYNGVARARAVEIGEAAVSIKSGQVLAPDLAGNTIHRLAGRVSVGHDVAANAALALDIPRGNSGAVAPKAFGLPSMTTTERNAISTPPARAMIWNSSTVRVEVYDGTQWQPLKPTQQLVAFSGTPSFDTSLFDHWLLAQLTGNIAITLTNPVLGNRGRIELQQDATGSRRVTGITVSGYTVLCKNDPTPADAVGKLNTTAMKVASARSTLYYEFTLVGITAICHVWMQTGVTPDYT